MIDDWRVALKEYLLAGGILGRTQSEVFNKVGEYASGDDIIAELEALWAMDQVQRFQVPASMKGKKKVTVWRATTELKLRG